MKGEGFIGWIDNDALRGLGAEIFGEGVYVEEGCAVEEGVKIYAPSYILSGTHLCRGATVKPFSYVEDSQVCKNATVFSSTLIGVHVGENATVGPYAYLRGGTYAGDNCRIGSFVEIKASTLGNGCKAAHLSYIGDAVLGERVNVGCGAVFANYDGKIKQNSTISDDVFIGCNCNVVAPVNIGKGAYIAAGTTITRDIGEYDFCIGRVQEHISKGGGRGRYSG